MQCLLFLVGSLDLGESVTRKRMDTVLQKHFLHVNILLKAGSIQSKEACSGDSPSNQAPRDPSRMFGNPKSSPDWRPPAFGNLTD